MPISPENLAEIDGSVSDLDEENIIEYETGDSCAPDFFSQSKQNDLLPDLHLTKYIKELFCLRLEEKNLIATGT